MDEDDEPAIQRRVRELNINQEAQRRVKAGKVERWTDLDVRTAADLLAQPLPASSYRIEGLWPSGGLVLLTAQAKTGKTTLILNLVRSLLTGEPFLGLCDVQPIEPDQTIVLIDLELDEGMLRRWLGDHGLGPDAERVVVLPWRGRAGRVAAALTDDAAKKQLVGLLVDRRAAVLLVDPFSAVLQAAGVDENDNTQVGRMLRTLVEVASKAGIDVLASQHSGREAGNRARGASAFEDVPDALWALEKPGGSAGRADSQNPEVGSPRTLSVRGRDVRVTKITLNYHPSSRHLAVAAADGYEDRVLKALGDAGEEGFPSLREGLKATPGNNEKLTEALNRLVDSGKVIKETRNGTKGGDRYRLPEFPSQTSVVLDSESEV